MSVVKRKNKVGMWCGVVCGDVLDRGRAAVLSFSHSLSLSVVASGCGFDDCSPFVHSVRPATFVTTAGAKLKCVPPLSCWPHFTTSSPFFDKAMCGRSTVRFKRVYPSFYCFMIKDASTRRNREGEKETDGERVCARVW